MGYTTTAAALIPAEKKGFFFRNSFCVNVGSWNFTQPLQKKKKGGERNVVRPASLSPPQPATVACKNESSVGICTHCMHFFARRFANLLETYYNKTSASELSRKFIKSALLVGCWLGPWSLLPPLWAAAHSDKFHLKSSATTIEPKHTNGQLEVEFSAAELNHTTLYQ